MDSSQTNFLLLLAPSIGALIAAVAAYVQSLANGRLGQENQASLVEVSRKVDGQLTKSREDAEAAVRDLNILQGRVESGEFDGLPEAEKRERLRLAKVDVVKLLEVAVLAAAELKRRTDEIEAKLGPEEVKATSLKAVHAAVEHEIAMTPPVAEVRKMDEI